MRLARQVIPDSLTWRPPWPSNVQSMGGTGVERGRATSAAAAQDVITTPRDMYIQVRCGKQSDFQLGESSISSTELAGYGALLWRIVNFHIGETWLPISSAEEWLLLSEIKGGDVSSSIKLLQLTSRDTTQTAAWERATRRRWCGSGTGNTSSAGWTRRITRKALY